MKKFRVGPRDFSRQNSKNSKGLTFSNTLRLILTGLRRSYKGELSDFFNADLSIDADAVPTAAAFCQARQKIQSDVFIHGSCLAEGLIMRPRSSNSREKQICRTFPNFGEEI